MLFVDVCIVERAAPDVELVSVFEARMWIEFQVLLRLQQLPEPVSGSQCRPVVESPFAWQGFFSNFGFVCWLRRQTDRRTVSLVALETLRAHNPRRASVLGARTSFAACCALKTSSFDCTAWGP